ncbi:MAG: DUF2294 domain-containing protein, partial [Phycisphaerae bacterium]
ICTKSVSPIFVELMLSSVKALRQRNLMMTQGEMEAAVCEGIAQFEQEYMGRGPKDVRCFLINDLLLIRLQGVLTAAEQHLVQTVAPEKGRDLLKDVRTQLIEIARPALEILIRKITGVNIVSLHHDISTISGEEVIIFSLESIPTFRKSIQKTRRS